MADADNKSFCLNTLISLTPTATPTIVSSNTTYLQINNVTVTNTIAEAIRSACTVTYMERYVKKKTGYNREQMALIDWNSLDTVLHRQTLDNTIRLIKFMNNWLNTG
eukprot:2571799-Ditylum_brightwellii.AAC.1